MRNTLVSELAVVGPDHLVLAFAVDERNPRRVLAVGGQRRDYLLRSADAGQTWTVLTSPGKGLRGAFLDGDLIWTAGEYGHVARSDDGGHTWTEYDIGFAGCLFGVTRDASGTVIIAGDNGYIAASRDNAAFKKVSGIKVSLSRLYKCNAGVFIPTDAPGDLVHLDIDSKGKVTATQHPIGPGDDLLTMTQAKHGTMVIVGKQGAIFRSTDNAQTWTRSTSPTTEMLFGVCVLDSGRFVAVGASGTVVASDDDGISFTALKVPTDGKRLWACVAVGDVVLVGGEEGRVFRLRNGHVPESVAELPAPQGERGIVPGIVVSDALRKMAWPWRGSTLTMPPRPLPTAQQAWSTLRAEIIGASAWRSVVLKKSSALLGLQIDPNAARRRLATRLANENVSAGSFVDDVALVALCFDDRFAPYDGSTRDAAIADLLVAQHGAAGAVERAIAGLRGDLPYHRMGLFERLRELVVTSSDADYAAVLALAQAMLDKARAAPANDDDDDDKDDEDEDVEEVSQELLVARRSVWSFLLPPGEKPHPVELALLERAVVTIREFGNTRIANAGLLASVDAAGFAKFLEENGDRRAHQYFSGGDRPYIATALLRGIDLVAKRLPEMRPGYNLRVDRWSLLLAHVDSDAAITTLTAEPVLTLFGGRAAAALQPARFFAHLEKRRAAGDDTALLEAALGAANVEVIPPSPALAPLAPTGAQAATTTTTTALPRGPLVVPPALDLPIELTWRDEERTASESAMPYDGHWRWQDDDVSDDDAFKEAPPLRSASAAAQERWVALREALRLPSPSAVYLLLPTKLHPRLMALGVAPEQGAWTSFRPALLRNPDTVDNVRIWMHHDGADLDDRLTVIQPLGDAWVVPAVVTGFAGKKNKALARSWILRHPRHAAAGALAMVLNDVDAVNAARVLRFVDGLGHRRTIQQLAASVDIAERVQSLLDDDPLLQKGVKLPSIPAWAKHAALPSLKDADGTTWTPDRVDALVVRLATSNPDEVNPVITAARQSLDKTSAATFARALFEAWLKDGADAKHVFAMHALGFFGDDASVRHLATLAKAWPGESAAARAQMALDTFVLHGGDVALLQLAMISEKSKFAAFEKGAVERITSIADMRGLTPDELADRLVPTFGLDDEASTIIDFGARKFFIAFDESLSPRVKDESGTLLKDLPKPNKNDDATLAAAGKKQLSALKKDVKTVADLLLRRFERMMIEGRSTDVDTFRAAFVEHPLTFHVARRVLWEAIDDNGTRLGLFRIAEDKSFADLNDDAWTLPPAKVTVARVRPVHPIDVDDASLTKASTVWGDYELLQPFAQLGRPVHRLGASIKDAATSTTLSTHNGKVVPAPTLVFGLEGKGWKRYDIIDGGAFTSHVKQYGDVEAIVDYDGAVGMGYIEANESLTVGVVSLTSKKLRRSLTLGDVPPRVLSEIVTDLDAALVGKGK